MRCSCRAAVGFLLGGFLTLAGRGGAAEPDAADLLRAVRSGEETARLRAIDTLASKAAKVPGAIPVLVEQLKDPSARVRVQTAEALGRLGPAAKEAGPALIALVADANVHVRRAAVRAVRGVRADPQLSVPRLITALEDPDAAVRLGALDALAEAGKPAVGPLVKALENQKTAYWACLGLGELGAEAAPAVPSLVEMLGRETRPEMRREVALTLGAIGPAAATAVPLLIQALGDADMSVRMAAVFALGRMGPAAQAADEPLQRLTTSPVPLLRTLSAWAAARIRPDDPQRVRRAVPLLVEALASREPRVRATAARALVDFRANPELIVQPVLNVLQAGGREVVDDVLSVAAALGEPAMPILIKALRYKEARARTAAVIGRIGPAAKEAVPMLIDVVKTDDPAAQREALLALGAIGPAAKSAVPVAVQAMQDHDMNVRYSACYALGKIGPPAFAARPALQERLDSADPFLSLVSAWALARIDPDCMQTAPKSLPLLVKALADPEPMVRLEAASSLRCLGPQAKTAAPAVKKVAADDPSDLVRDMAREALRAMDEGK